MKYLDEFRDPDLAEKLFTEIRQLTTKPWAIMEVCGGQTHSIIRHGIDQLLPAEIELIHGPGCPVCVTPLAVIDKALAISARSRIHHQPDWIEFLFAVVVAERLKHDVCNLVGAGEQAGVKIFVSSRALSYCDETQGIAVHTAYGEVHAAHLVLCGNTDLGGFAPTLQRRIMPVGTYMIATEPLGAERARGLIANNAAVTDTNWVLDYFRLSRDHRVLFGGRVAYGRYVDRDDGRATRARMLAVFPQLRDVVVDYSWGGRVDITMNRAPDFGRLSPRVFYLQGFSGHGIALTTIAGQLLATAIAGSAERFDVFSKIPHRPFPGGAILRRPALVLAMLWYRLRDLL